MRNIVLIILISSAGLLACVTESHQAVETQTVASQGTPYQGPKHPLVVGLFNSRSSYGQGVFTDNSNQLGNQAKTILMTHLQMSNRFQVLDRAHMDTHAQEAKLAGITQKIKGARLVITGDVTEFGRKVVGDKQLFGILGQGKSQVAYAKVMLNVVDVATSTVIHSVQAAGEYDLNQREVLGFGGSAGYDSTLNGKVLNLAVKDAVNQLVSDLEAKAWSI